MSPAVGVRRKVGSGLAGPHLHRDCCAAVVVGMVAPHQLDLAAKTAFAVLAVADT